ncbi:hypothetical protein DXG01_010051 [Tephrocybe rancida]|nr:hypothetical protein DXG01_010051 [Tephrocybe rancida]
MPTADNDPIGPALDGEKPYLGKRFLDRVKGPMFTKSSSTSSTPATKSMEIRAASSAADEKPLLSKRLLAPFKDFKFIKSSSAPSAPAVQSVEDLAAPGASAAQLAANIGKHPHHLFIITHRQALGVVTASAVSGVSASVQVVTVYTAASTTSAMNPHRGSLATPLAVDPTSVMSVDVTTAAMNSVSLMNTNQSASTGPNVPQDQSKFKEGVNVALDGCLTALRLAKDASDWNPFLKAALGGVMAVIDLAKTVSNNSQDMKDTLVHIQGLLPILETSAKRLEGRKDGFGKGNNLLAFAITMQAELEKIQQMQFHGLFRRMLQGASDADTLQGIYKNIDKALGQFKRAELHKLQTSTTAAHTAHIESDTIDRRTCALGTRLDVLKGILSWLQQQDGEPVYWLTGPAGIGKTTIAKTISCLAEALEKDSRLAHATLKMQLKQMLIQPWEASAAERVGLPPLIIVVDALDENQSGSEFLQHLLQAVAATWLGGLKFFVTSREDEQIFKLCNTLPQGTVLHLQDIQKQIVQDDIGLYLAQSLSGIHSNSLYQKLLEKLKERSDGLFIYAATVVKMVTANDAAVIEQVDLLQGIIDSSDSPQLGNLYCQIVKDAVGLRKSSVQASRLQVLHTILCAMHPISDTVVAQLAKTTVDVVATVLKKLHAVMYKAHNGMIYTYHASFADYILQNPAAAEIAFDPHCNVGLQHAFLAQRSYEIMEKQLCFNICGLESSFVKDSDVQGLQKCIQGKIDNSLKYAVLMWMAHLSSATDPDKALLNYPQLFVEKLLLYWMEVVNLLNARSEGMQMLDMLTAWIDKTSSPVYDIGISPDGKQVVSGGKDASVCIWDVLTGDLVKELKGHTHHVLSVAFSPDGKQVVSGSADKSVCIWDASTGNLVKEFKGHIGVVRSVAFSPDGKQVMSGSNDKSVCIWDALTGDVVKELQGHTNYVLSVAFSPDGKQVVSGSADKLVCIWDALTGNLVKELKGHTHHVLSVAFSPDGKKLVSGSGDKSVCIWDASTGNLVMKLKGHTKMVLSVAFSPDGKQVVSSGAGVSVCIWDILAGNLVKEFKGPSWVVWSVKFSPDGKQVMSGSNDKLVRIWDALTGDLVKEPKGHTHHVLSVAFSPDGKQVVSGSADKLVCIWDALTGDLVKELKGHIDTVWSVAFSPDGKQVVSGSSGGSVYIWDALTGDLLKELQGHTSYVLSVAFSSDGKQVVSGSTNNLGYIWDALTGDLVKELKGPSQVSSMAFSPDGKQVVSDGVDKSVHIWDALTGDLVKELKGHTNSLWSVSFSPDGRQVVSGGRDRSVCIWDTLTGDLVKELKEHTNDVRSVAFSPDGKHVVSGSNDKSVCIWDALTGGLVKKLKGHTHHVLSVAFSPDGKWVVSSSLDKSVRIWEALTGDPIKELKGHSSGDESLIFRTIQWASDVCLWSLDHHTGGALQTMFQVNVQPAAAPTTQLPNTQHAPAAARRHRGRPAQPELVF